MIMDLRTEKETIYPKCIDCGKRVFPFKGKYLCKDCEKKEEKKNDK